MRQAAPAMSDNVEYRVAWVDYAKGWSIVLVVTMHSAAIALPLAVSALARGTILEYVRPSWACTEGTACSGALAHAA
jgi:uncharacterized membrane protein YcfT